MVDPVTPEREQIAALTGADNRLLIALERLFQVAGDETPSNVDAAMLSAQRANALLNVLLSVVQELQDTPAPPAVPELSDDSIAPPAHHYLEDLILPPALLPMLETLTDVDLGGLVAGDALIFDGTQWVPISGASGTFTTSDPFTVTVTNGLITSIV